MDGQLTAMLGSALYPLCCLHRFADVHPRRWRRSRAVRGSLLYPVTWQVPNRSTFGPRCQWRSQHCQGPALSRGSRAKLPPDSGATARKSRSSNVSSRLVRNRWARTTTERSASPRSRASYCSPSLATVPCSSAVSPSTRNRPAATSRLVHHALDVARPLVRQREVRVDGPGQRVAQRALLVEHRVVLLDAGGVRRDVDRGRALVELGDLRLGGCIDLIVGGAHHAGPDKGGRSRPQEDQRELLDQFHGFVLGWTEAGRPSLRWSALKDASRVRHAICMPLTISSQRVRGYSPFGVYLSPIGLPRGAPTARSGRHLGPQGRPVCRRRHAEVALEDAVKPRDGPEARGIYDFGDAQRGVHEQGLGLFQPDARHIFGQRHAGRPLEELAEIEAAYPHVRDHQIGRASGGAEGK